MISKYDSLGLKGVAVLLLLFHHFFAGALGSVGVAVSISKVCVALFVFLSGYGLSASTPNDITFVQFLRKRIPSLMSTYWVIFILFVLIGVISHTRTLHVAYGEAPYSKLALEFLGLHEFFYGHGYNPTWWFMSLILLLYVLFLPFKRSVLKYGVWFPSLITLLSLFFLPKFTALISMDRINTVTYSYSYVVCFLWGIYFSTIGQELIVKERIQWITLSAAIVTAAVFRISLRNTMYCISFDVLIAIFLICIYQSLNISALKKVLTALGKYSYEVFLTHTFLLTFYLKRFQIDFGSRPLNFLQFVILSLLLGVITKWIVDSLLKSLCFKRKRVES